MTQCVALNGTPTGKVLIIYYTLFDHVLTWKTFGRCYSRTFVKDRILFIMTQGCCRATILSKEVVSTTFTGSPGTVQRPSYCQVDNQATFIFSFLGIQFSAHWYRTLQYVALYMLTIMSVSSLCSPVEGKKCYFDSVPEIVFVDVEWPARPASSSGILLSTPGYLSSEQRRSGQLPIGIHCSRRYLQRP